MKTVLVILAIIYSIVLIPATRVAIAFYLMRNKDNVAYIAMRHGFLFGFLSIWIIYPIFIVNDCFNSCKKFRI